MIRQIGFAMCMALIVTATSDGIGRVSADEAKDGAAGRFRFKHHFGDRDLRDDALGQTALADLDGDGDLDFITGKSRGTIWWYEYISADHWKKQTLGEKSPSDVGGAVMDVNRDGRIDFVTGGAWYENPGNPKGATFRRHAFDKRLAGVHDVTVGDLDGDQRPDVVTMSDQNDVRWYRIGDDPTVPWKMTHIGPSVHAGVCLGDLDGDGDLDVVRSNVWMENREGGAAWTEHKMTEPWGASSPSFAVNATRTRTADINADGRLDVVITDGENRGARIAWLEAPSNPRHGKWQIHYLPKADSARRGAYHSLQVGDFDNDGDVDIFTVEMEAFAGDRPPRWFIWENMDGRGRLAERVILDAKLGGHEAVIGDVDGDGDLDICSKLWRPMRANANGGKNHFDYLENLGTPRNKTQTFLTSRENGIGVVGVEAADASHLEGKTPAVSPARFCGDASRPFREDQRGQTGAAQQTCLHAG